MKPHATVLAIICFISVTLLLSTSSSVLAQEATGEAKIEELRRQNEALKKELEALRRQLDKGSEKRGEVVVTKTATVSTAVEGAHPEPHEVTSIFQKGGALSSRVRKSVHTPEGDYLVDESGPESTSRIVSVGHDGRYVYTMTTVSPRTGAVELTKWQLENVTLSHGDAGLETMLRFEKVKECRKAGKLDDAVEELKKIIQQNVSEVTTHAARLTLVEILEEQKKDKEAIAELEKIMATATDARSKRDAIYGIINLSGDDPDSKIGTIDRLLEELREKSSLEDQPPAGR